MLGGLEERFEPSYVVYIPRYHDGEGVLVLSGLNTHMDILGSGMCTFVAHCVRCHGRQASWEDDFVELSTAGRV
jgi:hypothetical protein